MAQYQSPEFNVIKGKIGGMIFQGSPNGAMMRPRTVPKQPRTDAQMAVRNAFSAGAAGWKALSNAQKAGWSSLAAQVTLKNRIGQPYTPTGRRLFMSCWQNNAIVGGVGPSNAPATMPVIGAVPGFAITASGPSGSAPQGQITMAGGFPLSGVSLVLRATPPLSFDKKYLGSSVFRVLTTLESGASAPTPAALASLYAARFGALLPETRIVFGAFLTDPSGFVGPITSADVVVGVTATVSQPASDGDKASGRILKAA